MSVDWDWSRVVFDHVKIVVRDASASMGFYKTVLEPLAIPPLWESDRGAQFANLVVWSDERPSGPVHIAFVADSVSRSTRSIALASRLDTRTTALPAFASSTAQLRRAATTPRSCSIPTATTSRQSAASSSHPRRLARKHSVT